jgi:hypothetical protein
MRRPGREFGASHPKVIYLALRWNSRYPTLEKERRLVSLVARHVAVNPDTIRVFNLVRPAPGRGMTLDLAEFSDAKDTISRIQQLSRRSKSLSRIIVGGASGPMPFVALLLRQLLPPRIRVELRTHHRARAVNRGPLAPLRVRLS